LKNFSKPRRKPTKLNLVLRYELKFRYLRGGASYGVVGEAQFPHSSPLKPRSELR